MMRRPLPPACRVLTMAPDLVLDTNVVLDLLVFRDPASRPLYEALRERRVIWLSCDKCRDEFLRVIDYKSVRGFLSRRAQCATTRFEEAIGEFDNLSTTVAGSQHALASTVPRCKDRNDQYLVDFAIGARADFLISKDRHLTDLANWFSRNGQQPRVLTLDAFVASESLPRT